MKTVEFYQSVRDWDNKERKTFKEDEGLKIYLTANFVELVRDNADRMILVPYANLRYATAPDVEVKVDLSELIETITEPEMDAPKENPPAEGSEEKSRPPFEPMSDASKSVPSPEKMENIAKKVGTKPKSSSNGKR